MQSQIDGRMGQARSQECCQAAGMNIISHFDPSSDHHILNINRNQRTHPEGSLGVRV
jgi:hypothetical protein